MNNQKQVDSSHYDWLKYCAKSRWCSFWHQIDEIVSLDIADDLKPDYLGNVLDIPLGNNIFDVIVCFQILEHIPYESFRIALSELFRVSKNHVIISLPDASKLYPQILTIPKLGKINFSLPIPIKLKKHVFDGEHHWEINKAETPLKRIKKDILEAGFKICKTYRVFENPYHRFFVLSK